LDEQDEAGMSDIIRQINVEGLKKEVQEVVGAKMSFNEADDADPVISEQFWTNVLEFEKADWTTYIDLVQERGLALPKPDTVSDAEVGPMLWKLIDKLADLGVTLEDTNHLSDRDLYAYLYDEGLREETKWMGPDSGWSVHLSPIGSGSAEDMFIYHKYYASEEMRQSWLKDWPDDPMPPHEDPPYDRDRRLP
jgi:hypothetical protein